MGLTCELHHLMFRGASAGIVPDPQTLSEDIKKVCPTILLAVPRVYNTVYSAVWKKIQESNPIKQIMFKMALANSKTRRELQEKNRSSFIPDLLHNVYDNLVFKKVREGFGGRLNYGFCGSAALSVPIANFFNDIGIPIYTAYGLTETAPVVSMERPNDCKVGSSGKPIEMVDIVIDKSVVDEESEDGEIVIYGPNVMKGYFNKPDQTKEVLMEDSGLRTGDRGKLDDDGFLFITGRIKEQFKLENGKYVFPVAIEEEIKLHPLVENVMVYGYNKPYTIAIIIPDFTALDQGLKEQLHLSDDKEEIVKSKEFQQHLQTEILHQLKGQFGNYEIPQKMLLLSESFTIENGYLTPTQKLKRRVVLNNFQSNINHLYQ
jgi:long-chain acyl-CoA synthetase